MMYTMKKLGFVIAFLSVMLAWGCDSSPEASNSQVSLLNGRHYLISNVETGWEGSESTGLMLPYVEFDITNNGTSDITAMTLFANFRKPSGNTLGEVTRIITSFSSGSSKHYRLRGPNGYDLQDGTWNSVISRSTSVAVVVGVLFSNESSVSSENTERFIIDD